MTLVHLEEADHPSPDKLIGELRNTITVYTQNLVNSQVRHSKPFRHLRMVGDAYRQVTSQAQYADGSEGRSVSDLTTQIRHSVKVIADQAEEAGVIVIDTLLSSIWLSSFSRQDMLLCYRTFLDAMDELAREYNVKPAYAGEDLAGMSPEQLAAFSREHARALLHEIFVKLDNRQHKYFVEAKNYMEAHYMDCDLSLHSIAAHIGISASYLSRIFTTAYNMRFTQKLNELRIERSKELLADETKLIRDIGEEVGFLTVQNFMRVFKQRTGITPGEYRLALTCRKSPPPSGS